MAGPIGGSAIPAGIAAPPRVMLPPGYDVIAGSLQGATTGGGTDTDYIRALQQMTPVANDPASIIAAGGHVPGPYDQPHESYASPEAVIPLDLSHLGVTTSTYTGPSPGQLQAQLGAQIAGLQAAGNRASGDIGGLYNALAGQLSRYIPLENAAYNQEYGRVGGLFGGLDRSIQQTYGTSLRDIQGEMQRLGIANRMPVATAPMLSDEALTRANTGNLAGGTLGALRLLQAGANTYNRDVVGMARTEGANRQADIRQGILAAIINARQQNAAVVAAPASYSQLFCST